MIAAAGTAATDASINRNIVECKFTSYKQFLETKILVLIETLWNVNLSPLYQIRLRIAVLIETLWNVNTLVIGNLKVRVRY